MAKTWHTEVTPETAILSLVAKLGQKCHSLQIKKIKKVNFLLTEHEGRTGEYWPEVVVVRTERNEVRRKTTEADIHQYGPVQAKLVSSLLYGIIFRTKQHFR